MSDTRKRPKTKDALLKAFADLGVQKIEPPKVIKNPTGILSLDIALKGGLPEGRMLLWYGQTGSGKSTSLYLIFREQLRRGNPCLLIDAERSFTAEYAKLLGFTDEMLDLLTVLVVETAEQAWDAIIMALGHYKVIGIDTLAKLTPSTELEASVSKIHMGLQPKINAQATRIWGNELADSGSTVIFLNQQRSNLTQYGSPNLNPGGKAIEFESAITLYQMTQKSTYKDGRPETLVFRYRFEKNKVNIGVDPKLEHELHIACSPDAYEVDYPYELFTAAKEYGVLKDKTGAPWQKNVAFFEGTNLGNGEAQIIEWLSNPSEVRDQIEAAVFAAVQGTPDQAVREGRGDTPVRDDQSDDPAGDIE